MPARPNLPELRRDWALMTDSYDNGDMMCKYGDTVLLLVPVGSAMKWKPVDKCIAPIVRALNINGIQTIGSCCGHGKEAGSILLSDGRELIIKSPHDLGGGTRGRIK